MAFPASDYSSTERPHAATHNQISSRFTDPLDCLAAHLMLESSEVLAGVKPANLISLTNNNRPCGRNLFHLWQSHHVQLSRRLDLLCFKVLQTRDNAFLLLCYNAEHLTKHLSHAGIRALLSKSGYDTTASSEALLTELCCRFKNNTTFPHEIGLFIGYPAKDVAAFMGLINIPFTCQGPWKIYGDPRNSLRLADTYRQTRKDMSCKLSHCISPFECLASTTPSRAFFFNIIDIDVH